MKSATNLSENFVNNKTTEIDKKYRENFKEYNIEAKRLTHKCQFECYNKIKENIYEAESCARNCFLPLIYIKKNISKISENCKENLEKCKFSASSNNNDGRYEHNKIRRCLKLYEDELFKTKDEAEYIYSGYIKNFSDIMNNVHYFGNDL